MRSFWSSLSKAVAKSIVQISIYWPSSMFDVRYCESVNVRENIIFANGVERHICDVQNSRLGHNLPVSVNDRMISPFREDCISRNFAFAKFRENKPSRKFPYL